VEGPKFSVLRPKERVFDFHGPTLQGEKEKTTNPLLAESEEKEVASTTREGKEKGRRNTSLIRRGKVKKRCLCRHISKKRKRLFLVGANGMRGRAGARSQTKTEKYWFHNLRSSCSAAAVAAAQKEPKKNTKN